MNPNYTAIILSGGKSSRIGEDKALLKLNGVAIIERIYNLLDTIFEKTIIISNDTEKYKFLTHQVYEDIYPGFGPLSGIHSGLINSDTNDNFIISCDMPLVNEEVINFILSNNSESDIVLSKSKSNIHLLCAVYKKSCIKVADNLLKTAYENTDSKNGKTKIRLFDLINSMQTDYIELTGEIDNVSDIMFNMNTLDDYEFVKRKLI